MIFNDEAMTEQFATIGRIAEMLEQATLVGRSIASRSGDPALAAAVTGVQKTSVSVCTNDGVGVVAGQSPAFVSGSATGFRGGGRCGTSAAVGSVATISLQDDLVLPRSCGASTLLLLAALGHHLRVAKESLERQVEQHLVDFYHHIKKREISELREIALHRRVAPPGFVMLTNQSPPAGVGPGRPWEETLSRASSASRGAVGSRAASEGPDALPELRCGPLSSGSGTRGVRDGGEMRGRVTVQRHALTGRDGTRGRGGEFGAILPHAQLTRKPSEQRTASGLLQSFLYLLLESALTHSDGTGAAVYLSSARSQVTQPGAAGPRVAPPVATSGETTNTPRFLHCVTTIGPTNLFPPDVSYATMNVLVSVVQSGVAANLRSCKRAAGNAGGGGSSTRPVSAGDVGRRSPGILDGTEGACNEARTHVALNIDNGLIVPIRGYGCLVLANKQLCGDAEGFSVSDEHMAWSAALFCETLFSRYKHEILMQSSWRPVGLDALRHFMHLTRIDEPASGPRTSRHSIVAPRQITAPSGDAVDVVALVNGKTMENRLGAKILTVVRTSERNIGKLVPDELLSALRRGRGGGRCRALSEEDLFQGAAQYISNLESLWSQSLTENNSMRTVVSNFTREMDAKANKIYALEGKVRRLNARIVQLERYHSTRRVSAVPLHTSAMTSGEV